MRYIRRGLRAAPFSNPRGTVKSRWKEICGIATRRCRNDNAAEIRSRRCPASALVQRRYRVARWEDASTMLTRHVDVHLASVLFSSLILTPLIFYALLCAVSLRPSVWCLSLRSRCSEHLITQLTPCKYSYILSRKCATVLLPDFAKCWPIFKFFHRQN